MSESILGGVLFRLYRIPRRCVRWAIRKAIDATEGGELYSVTLRRIFREYHGVDIGMYTHGGCFIPGALDRLTTVGRYSSVAACVRVMNSNHPVQFKSTHAFFFNPDLGRCKVDPVPCVPLNIGSDVWLGHGALILPNVTEIGHGAVVAAGSVVNKNVPPYAIVAGNPARIVRYRFSKEVIDDLLASGWWEKEIEEIEPQLEEYQQPYERLVLRREGWQEPVEAVVGGEAAAVGQSDGERVRR
jgi:virginiamycin A acetyltransferase